MTDDMKIEFEWGYSWKNYGLIFSHYTNEFWFNLFPSEEEWAELLVRLARLSLASPDPFLSPVGRLSESDVTLAESSKLSEEALSKLEFMNNMKSISDPEGFKEISLIDPCPQMDSVEIKYR